MENPIFMHDFLATQSTKNNAFSNFSVAPQVGLMVLGSEIDLSQWTHSKETLWGRSQTVISIANKKYLVGVQIAKLLKRETFNLYRSMKVKGIEVARASSEQVDYLMRTGAVKRGTRSVTLVSYDSAKSFVNSELHRTSPSKRDNNKKRESPSVSEEGEEEEETIAQQQLKRGRSNSRVFDGISVEEILVSLSRAPVFWSQSAAIANPESTA